MTVTQHDDASGFGCPAFGHLASAFVDLELAEFDLDRFRTHLPGCEACQRLTSQYRAIDAAAMPAYPRPREAEWDAAWISIRNTVEADRAEAARSPAGAFLRWLEGLWPRASWAGPLAAAAAAVTIIGLTLALRQAWAPAGQPQGVSIARGTATGMGSVTPGQGAVTPGQGAVTPGQGAVTPGEGAVTIAGNLPRGADILSVSCQHGWEAVVWTIGGEDPTTVVQCQPVET